MRILDESGTEISNGDSENEVSDGLGDDSCSAIDKQHSVCCLTLETRTRYWVKFAPQVKNKFVYKLCLILNYVIFLIHFKLF